MELTRCKKKIETIKTCRINMAGYSFVHSMIVHYSASERPNTVQVATETALRSRRTDSLSNSQHSAEKLRSFQQARAERK